MCEICKQQILVAIFKGTGVCSEHCRKIRDGEV
jgi:predicted nucleic acid-binding Zn ribbon protein